MKHRVNKEKKRSWRSSVDSEVAIKLQNVTKRFGDIIANDNVNLLVKRGEILSILGENGSGKTTLMNMLSGIYFPDHGDITVHGKKVTIRSPKDAFALGIGMIHQHFKLIDVLTAAENIILGLPGSERLDMKSIVAEVNALVSKYGFELDPEQKIYDMSVSQKQTVEIVKVLYRGAEILILDEPTAVLTPQETSKLFDVLRNMRKAGKSIIIITHKLNEVMAISDRVTVLRKGQYIGSIETKEATVDVLTEMMVGQKIDLEIERTEPMPFEGRIEVKNITCRNRDGIAILKDVSFASSAGEILGIAGIAGSGQKELLEAVAGLQEIESGEILYHAPEGNTVKISEMKAAEIRDLKISLAFVPEDRLGMGLVGSMDLTDNIMLRSYNEGKHFFANRKTPRKLANRIVEKLSVVTPSVDTPVRKLSGGNVQKILLGREIATSPNVLMVAYPVRGLDINSSYTIYKLLGDQKQKGASVICVGEDLDVLMALCDRIVVLSGGELTGIVDARTITKEAIGLLMTSSKKGGAHHAE
jgi:simple sugar transport system ATP-binding protein